MGDGPEAALFQRYRDRVRPKPALVEVPEARGAEAEARRREGQALLAAVPKGARLVALDQDGKQLDTLAFARLLLPDGAAGRSANGTPDGALVCFLIGGASGLDPAVTRAASALLSLGAMTWPHLLARAMLAEQIFRAYSIACNHPYHRAERP